MVDRGIEVDRGPIVGEVADVDGHLVLEVVVLVSHWKVQLHGAVQCRPTVTFPSARHANVQRKRFCSRPRFLIIDHRSPVYYSPPPVDPEVILLLGPL